MSYEDLSPQQKARIAFMRFGLGPKPGWSARIGMEGNSARQACLDELEQLQSIQITDSNLPDATSVCIAKWYTLRAPERAARAAQAMVPEIGFLERLALFWTNHFTVYQAKVPGTAGLMDRKAIRPLVLGMFKEMLKTILEHPAMIVYLDNQVSVSPNSVVGKKNGWSYNENLAREILELHTLGVGGGYQQQDVTNFALILTGWTTNGSGDFLFRADYHDQDNAPVVFMGKTYSQVGKAQGDAVIADLAASPATAQHIAYKLIRHFVTDDPPSDMVQRLADVFLSNDGDLTKVYQALLAEPYSWTAPINRIRTPYVWMLSMMRARGTTPESARLSEFGRGVSLGIMGHVLWGRLTPDGYPDDNYVWEDPNAVRIRKDVAHTMSLGLPFEKSTAAVVAMAQDLLPGIISQDTLNAMSGSTSNQQALSILFASAEYLRR